MEKLEGEKPLGKHRRRWEDNMKVYIQEVLWGHGSDWSVQDRDRWRTLVNAVMKLWFP
jgi:hypothetical protein